MSQIGKVEFTVSLHIQLRRDKSLLFTIARKQGDLLTLILALKKTEGKKSNACLKIRTKTPIYSSRLWTVIRRII